MFFVDVDIMTTDQLKEVLGNYKWTLLVALIMFAMVGFGYKLARIIDEGDSKKVQAQQETIAILSEENHALTTKVNQLEVAMELATLERVNIPMVPVISAASIKRHTMETGLNHVITRISWLLNKTASMPNRMPSSTK